MRHPTQAVCQAVLIQEAERSNSFANDTQLLQQSTVFGISTNAADQIQPQSQQQTQQTQQTQQKSQTICVICDEPLPYPLDSRTVEISSLKPRFLRELKKLYPLRPLPPNYRVCTKDLAQLMQSRIETLLEQDQRELSRLQNEAMKNLGEYEQREQNWQKQFEQGWTLSEKAADIVARFGGSWRFIGVLIGFLAFWALTNILLSQSWSTGSAWDPYPFILLNLFLSMIAALQAPVIMMSQNRQAQLDRLQSDYVSTIILRSEHQVRHVNAKLDHLLNEQWRRLLEIQQTQTDLLQMLQFRHYSHIHPEDAANVMKTPSKLQQSEQTEIDVSLFTNPLATPNPFGIVRSESFSVMATSNPSLPRPTIPVGEIHWCVETHPDNHVKMLLAEYFGIPHNSSPSSEELLFAHWHTDGDNFIGFVSDVQVEVKHSSPVVRRIVYDMTFNDPSATLDDILAGEGTVELRNDFDVKCMDLDGRYLRVEIHHKDKSPAAFPNGDLPPRYKSTFAHKREDKITDFWKQRVSRLNFTYSPPHQVAVLSLSDRQICERMRVDFFPENTVNHAKVYMRRLDLSVIVSAGDQGVDGMLSYMKEVVGKRPLSKSWIPVAYALWPENY
ncbi:hypothetical protein HK100_012425, partial [Physocladia obscura]